MLVEAKNRLWVFPLLYDQSSFLKINLANLPNLAKRCTFNTKYLNLSSKNS